MSFRQTADRGTPRADLGVALREYEPDPNLYVGLQVLPIFPVMKKTGSFSSIKRGSFLRRRNVDRKPGQIAARDGFEQGSVTFNCKNYAFESKLPDEEVEYYASEFDAEMETANGALHVLLREQERRIAAKLNDVSSAGFYSSDSTLYTDVATAWTDAAAVAEQNVDAAREQIKNKTGLSPDTLVLSSYWKRYLKQHTAIRDAIKYTQTLSDRVLLDELANLFGLRRVLFADAVENTAAENETDAVARVWSTSYAVLLVTAATNRMAEPCIGRTLLWDALVAENVGVRSYYENQTKSQVIGVEQYTDENIFDYAYGHCMKID